MIETGALFKGHYQRGLNAVVAVAVVGGALTTIKVPIGTRFVQFFTDQDLAIEVGYDDDAVPKPIVTSQRVKDGEIIQVNDDPGRQCTINVNAKSTITTATYWTFQK